MNVTDWEQSVLRPILSGQYPKTTNPITVFSADTDQTQTYVFESDKLPEIRGGSIQLSLLNKPQLFHNYLQSNHGLSKDCLLYAGGGSVLALLPNEEIAEHMAWWLQGLYSAETSIVTITCVWDTFSSEMILDGRGQEPPNQLDSDYDNILAGYHEPFGTYDTQWRESFSDVVSQMGVSLRKAKENRHLIPFVETLPFAQVCEYCRERPVNQATLVGDGSVQSCDICATKRRKGNGDERNYWIKELYNDMKDIEVDFELPSINQITYPSDIADLTRNKEVAFIYADGDAVGDRLLRCQNPTEYHQLSTKIEMYTKKAVSHAIMRTFAQGDFMDEHTIKKDVNGKYIVSWEVITIGGDDILMLVPARHALRFVLELLTHFDELAADEEISMSAGFAIAQPATPVRLLQETAKNMLKQAKMRRYHLQHKMDELIPCLSYHNFTREGFPQPSDRNRSDDAGHLLFTGRPYTLAEGWQLFNNIEALRASRFPRTQLHNLLQEMLRDRNSKLRSMMFYNYQFARMSNEHQNVMRHIEEQWQTKSFPWIQQVHPKQNNKLPEHNRSVVYTILQDMVSLYD